MYDKLYTKNVLRFYIDYDIVRDVNIHLFTINGLKLDLKYFNTLCSQ